MVARTRSRILCLAAIVAVIVGVRELSIRRHAADLRDWPSHDDSASAS